MRARTWQKYLEEQRERYGKVLFTVTELANVACASPSALNVELARLRQQEIIVRYAHGLYGMPGVISPQALVAAIDPHAYITGHYALYVHQMVTQIPVAITCFTNRRSPRAKERVTPVGRLVFVCVRSKVYYLPVADGAIAPPEQAICDYVYLSRRHGVDPETLVTFQNLERIKDSDLTPILARYPVSAQKQTKRIIHRGFPAVHEQLARTHRAYDPI
ncbi:MAG: hypothetical protein U9N87_07005 [Planctomycetota bacterium]|nr:hypothetical protein [Planctomycetota bacterium]